eukprot:11014948-Lingulodinium_polyedra.AAC.1
MLDKQQIWWDLRAPRTVFSLPRTNTRKMTHGLCNDNNCDGTDGETGHHHDHLQPEVHDESH